ncbi:MAG: hypothetical protein COT73_05205 [Bdellovibrio sp. CG10_big_fil_rev_8_21_14_0_10_47_8]|nr:MAG: hypothetical protein COT73_05205 [Bdellovibrio sp. CG10_big_fil_rev_8_21_14_0_10_47_8]
MSYRYLLSLMFEFLVRAKPIVESSAEILGFLGILLGIWTKIFPRKEMSIVTAYCEPVDFDRSKLQIVNLGSNPIFVSSVLVDNKEVAFSSISQNQATHTLSPTVPSGSSISAFVPFNSDRLAVHFGPDMKTEFSLRGKPGEALSYYK